jgi:hypothetical protein
MFCPKCRLEYFEGITTCTDCGVLLVQSIAELEPHEFVESIAEHEPYKFVEILQTFNHADIAVIKSILDDADIEFLFIGEQLAEPARLAVREDQVDEARKVLKDIDLRYLETFSSRWRRRGGVRE